MLIRFAPYLTMVALLCNCAVGAADTDPSKISVEVIGLRVARPHALKEHLLWPSGTTLSLLVSSTAGEFIYFSANDSVIAKFVDDKGTELQERPKVPAVEPTQSAGFAHAPKIDKDARNCIVEISAPGLPAKGAARIQLAGTITMLCATKKKETVVPNVLIQNETSIAGPDNLKLKVVEMNASPRNLDRDAMCFVLRAQHEMDNVAEIKFFRPEGSEVKAVRTSTSTLSIQGRVEVDWSYTFPERMDVGTIKLYTWSDIEKKRVKVDLTVDIGL